LILLNSASQVARIIGVSHWHPAVSHIFCLKKSLPNTKSDFLFPYRCFWFLQCQGPNPGLAHARQVLYYWVASPSPPDSIFMFRSMT
jgi:hypothetical protein